MNSSPLIQHLQSILILKDLDERSIQGLSHYFETRTFAESQSIICENDSSNHVLAMCSGSARVTRTGAQGKQVMIRDMHQGELFGDWAAIDNLPRSANVTALSNCVVGFISQKNFLTLLTHNPNISLRQMQQLTGYLREMNTRMAELVTLKANQRIQKVLLELARTSEDGLYVDNLPTHQEIAMRANTQREVVARELSKLQAEGLVLKNKSGYVITRPEMLEYQSALQSHAGGRRTH